MRTSVAKRQAWLEHVTAWQSSGQTQREYCARRRISYHAFDYWRRFVIKRQSPPQSAFIPIVAAHACVPESGGAIEVRLPSGASLVWPNTRALSELAQRLRALSLA